MVIVVVLLLAFVACSFSSSSLAISQQNNWFIFFQSIELNTNDVNICHEIAQFRWIKIQPPGIYIEIGLFSCTNLLSFNYPDYKNILTFLPDLIFKSHALMPFSVTTELLRSSVPGGNTLSLKIAGPPLFPRGLYRATNTKPYFGLLAVPIPNWREFLHTSCFRWMHFRQK